MEIYTCIKCGISFRKLEWAEVAACPACGLIKAPSRLQTEAAEKERIAQFPSEQITHVRPLTWEDSATFKIMAEEVACAGTRWLESWLRLWRPITEAEATGGGEAVILAGMAKAKESTALIGLYDNGVLTLSNRSRLETDSMVAILNTWDWMEEDEDWQLIVEGNIMPTRSMSRAAKEAYIDKEWHKVIFWGMPQDKLPKHLARWMNLAA